MANDARTGPDGSAKPTDRTSPDDTSVAQKLMPLFPNESQAYRQARVALQAEEVALARRVKAVAAQRRALPRGGEIKEDYAFHYADDARLGTAVRLSELFGEKDTLLLYSFMFGPDWEHACPSCTSLMDGFDRTTYQVSQDAAFVAVAKAPASKINQWAKQRDWTQITLLSGYDCTYHADYRCQGASDNDQHPAMRVFKREPDGTIYLFWGTELDENDLDTIWAYWNLMDMTPAGRPNREDPPQTYTFDR